jgi:serine/threonine-protein kinase
MPDATPIDEGPASGQILAGKYRLEERLGEGGMGVVFAAEHLVLQQRVAVKFLSEEIAGSHEARERFLREARAAAMLKNEHVVRVLDVAETEGGTPYMVMELLVGADLSTIQRVRGMLPVRDVADYMLQACEGIAEAHGRGIVHRDLKPANLFVTQHGDGTALCKVLDFGLSKPEAGTMLKTETSLTYTGAVMGSPRYMSPEQIRSAKDVDARTDIWALGAIIYRLLTDQIPFEGETIAAVSASIAADAPRPLREHRPELPEELEALVLKCLAKDPAARVQSVAELAAGLAPFASPEHQHVAGRVERLLQGRASFSSLPAVKVPVALKSGSFPAQSRAPTEADGRRKEPSVGSILAATSAAPARDRPRGRGLGLGLAIGVLAGAGVLGVLVALRVATAPEPQVAGEIATAPAAVTAPAAAVPAAPASPTAPAIATAIATPSAPAASSRPPASSSAAPSESGRPSAAPPRGAAPAVGAPAAAKPKSPGDLLDRWSP